MRIKSAIRASRGARKNQPFASPTLTCGTTQNAPEREDADARAQERRPSANAAFSQLLRYGEVCDAMTRQILESSEA
jgi:hypothetical protein